MITTPFIDLELGEGPDAYSARIRSEHLVEVVVQGLPYLSDADLQRVGMSVIRELTKHKDDPFAVLDNDRPKPGDRYQVNGDLLVRALCRLLGVPNEPAPAAALPETP